LSVRRGFQPEWATLARSRSVLARLAFSASVLLGILGADALVSRQCRVGSVRVKQPRQQGPVPSSGAARGSAAGLTCRPGAQPAGPDPRSPQPARPSAEPRCRRLAVRAVLILVASWSCRTCGVRCAYTGVMSTAKDERLHLRLEPAHKALLEAASSASGSTVSAFVLRTATEAAADILADRRVFVLDEAGWQAFDHALERPAAEVAGLRELLTAPTVLDRSELGQADR
jgi:uncharacterized protein (DUF1778 family)